MRRLIFLASVLWLTILGAGVYWSDSPESTLGSTLGPDSSTEPVLEPQTPGLWFAAITTAFSRGCTMPIGPEPNHSLTASGAPLEPNWHVAADGDYYPFGTVLQFSYDGITTTRLVADRGRAIKGRDRFDLAMADCDRARAWGRRVVSVRVLRRPLGSK